MSEAWQRIFVATFLSISGCVITYSLTTHSKKSFRSYSTEKPVAVLIDSENEVQRRPSERLVWKRVFNQQPLYNGEAVRTESDSSATLEFVNRKTVVQLDPDTVVEIESGDQGINLDFLKGNLFVKSGSANDSITLSSGSRKIAIENADVSLSKADANSPLQIEVTRGNIKEDKLIQQLPRIQLRRPSPRQVSYVQPGELSPVVVEWFSLDNRYQVSVEAGPSPSRLTKISDYTKYSNAAQLLLAHGRHYIRVSAVDPTGALPAISSFTRRIDLRAKLAPITLEPANSGVLSVSENKPSVDFRWSNPGQLENLNFEYARANNFRVDHVVAPMRQALSAKVQLRWSTGEIFWRVSGTIPGTQEVIASPIAKFELSDTRVAEPLKIASTPVPTPLPKLEPTPAATPVAQATPEPTSTPQRKLASVERPKIQPPTVDEILQKDGIAGKTDGTADLNWKPVSKATEYQVQVKDAQGQVVQTSRVKTNATTLTDLKTGEYKVTLNAIDQKGVMSASSKEITLTMPEYSSVRAPKLKSVNIK